MATFIISGSRGTDDSTMATLPFMATKVAKGARAGGCALALE